MEKDPQLEFETRLADLYKAERPEDSLTLILEEENKRPGDPDVLAAKAVALGILGRHEEAIRVADEAVALNPTDAQSLHVRGVALHHSGKYAEAIEAFDAALAITPGIPIALQLKISSLILSSRFSEAAKTYEESDLPSHAEEIWYNNLGYMYLSLEKTKEAGSFLYGAKVLDPFLPTIYYNLARLWWRLGDPIRFLKHGAVFLVLRGLEKIGWLEKIKPKRSGQRPHITDSKFFWGSGRLFTSDSQARETRSILKLLRGPNATALCNDTINWFAVNIPFETAKQNGFKGDIDIILKRPRYFGERDAGFTYRGFQVKTVVVDRLGNIKSSKRGSGKKNVIKKQLNFLKKFGCEQVFLLEIFVLERGYSSFNRFPSVDIAQEILEKAKLLEGSGYGYVVMAEEPSTTHDDESGGMMFMPINVLLATSNPIGSHFQELVDAIDAFFAEPTTIKMTEGAPRQRGFGPRIGYCSKCKALTLIIAMNPTTYVCGRCKAPLC